MKKIKIVGLSVLGLMVLSLGAIVLIPADDGYDAGMAKVCSDLTKDKMKSPRSYILDSVTISQRKPSDAETESKLSETSVEAFKDLVRKGRISYFTADIYIEYEAANSFGVLMKNTASCRYDIMKSSSSSSIEMVSYQVGGERFIGTDLAIILAAKDSRIGNGGIAQKIEYLKLYLSGKM